MVIAGGYESERGYRKFETPPSFHELFHNCYFIAEYLSMIAPDVSPPLQQDDLEAIMVEVYINRDVGIVP